MYADSQAAVRYVREKRKIPLDRLVFYGESLGCANAVHAALDQPPRGIILEAPFTSVESMCRHYYPFLPCRWVVHYKYDTLSKIKNVRSPLLVLQSPQDEIVPFAMGQSVFAAAPGPKTLVRLRGSHNEGFLDSAEMYSRAIEKFLKSRP
jgi:fermentation-respiration switch protein FrsA (DUF1100 family)